MVCVGIDVARTSDCFIISSGEILADVFTIPNNAELRRSCTYPA